MLLSLDQVNASFEMTGAVFRVYDYYRLYKDKQFKGGSLWGAAFFFIWGLFNIVFYPSLGQYWSFSAALSLTTINSVWMVMAIYYNYFRNKGMNRV